MKKNIKIKGKKMLDENYEIIFLVLLLFRNINNDTDKCIGGGGKRSVLQISKTKM